MKIGIYGGTFNPPHLGHFQAAKTAVEALGLDKLFFVPAALPPHKELPEGTPPASERLAMLEKMADALGPNGLAAASPIELKRGGKSYTADTVEAFHMLYPDAELWLLMGTDMFLTLQNWREPEKILKLAGVCAFGRAEQDGEELFAPQREYLSQKFNARVTTVTLPGLVDISSTRLRGLLARGAGREYLLPSVYGHILMGRLYGTNADLKHLDLPELRACTFAMMKAKRVPHVLGVEEEAVRLTKRWGGDEITARRAAILHDCTKYLELPDQLSVCAKYGVELDELEKTAVKLLHSKTGACMARYVFGEPEQVYEAIFRHTTGSADMALLDKIIYMADYIEPNRSFDGVERLRELAYRDLDRALLLGLETTVEEMRQRGLRVHPSTLAAIDWLRAQGIHTEEQA